jgi:ABC-type glycerol-3-phosphate transport system substrate-binding protein
MRKYGLGLFAAVLLIAFVAAPVVQAQVTLKFACWDYELNQYDKTLIEEFERRNPDIKVEVYDMPRL